VVCFFKLVLTLLCLGTAKGDDHPTDVHAQVVNQLRVALSAGLKPSKPGLHNLQGLLVKLGKEARGGTRKEENEALDMVEEAVERTLEPEIVEKIEEASLTLQGLSELFLKCEEKMDTLLNKSQTTQQEVITHRADHKLCRTEESEVATEHESCAKLLSSAKSVEASVCQTVEAVSQIPAATECLPNPGEDAEGFLLRKLAEFEAGLEKVEVKQEECDNATAYADKYEESCTTKTVWHTENKTKCDDKQLVLDSSICKLKAHMSVDCSEYEACRDKAFEAFALANSSAEFDEETAKQMWVQLQQIKCLVNAIRNNAHEDEMAACVITQFSVAHLNVNHSRIPASAICQSLAEAPGSEEYMDALYGDLPANAPAQACEASCCPPPVTTTTTTTASARLLSRNTAARNLLGNTAARNLLR